MKERLMTEVESLERQLQEAKRLGDWNWIFDIDARLKHLQEQHNRACSCLDWKTCALPAEEG
ncbi:MAG: hypothetical protein WC824_08110 [Bacteroidota bacterium]|jgi:hypothetical protein